MKTNQKMFMLLAVTASMVMGACSNDPETPLTPKPKLEVTPAALSVTSSAVEKELSVATKSDWTAKVTPAVDWIQLSKTSGSGDTKVKVSILANSGTESGRTASIVFTAGEGASAVEFPVSVEQTAKGTDEVTLVGSMTKTEDAIDLFYLGAFAKLWPSEPGILVKVTVDGAGTITFNWNIDPQGPDVEPEDPGYPGGGGYVHSFFYEQPYFESTVGDVKGGLKFVNDGTVWDQYGDSWNGRKWNGTDFVGEGKNTPFIVKVATAGDYYLSAKPQDRYLAGKEIDFHVKLEVKWAGEGSVTIYRSQDELPDVEE